MGGRGGATGAADTCVEAFEALPAWSTALTEYHHTVPFAAVVSAYAELASGVAFSFVPSTPEAVER